MLRGQDRLGMGLGLDIWIEDMSWGSLGWYDSLLVIIRVCEVYKNILFSIQI